jgi:hypothetical protein
MKSSIWNLLLAGGSAALGAICVLGFLKFQKFKQSWNERSEPMESVGTSTCPATTNAFANPNVGALSPSIEVTDPQSVGQL